MPTHAASTSLATTSTCCAVDPGKLSSDEVLVRDTVRAFTAER